MTEFFRVLKENLWLLSVVPVMVLAIVYLIKKGYLKKVELPGFKMEFNSDKPALKDDISSPHAEITFRNIKVSIENKNELYSGNAPFEQEWLEKRIREYYRVHFSLFPDNNGFNTFFKINKDYFGVLSLDFDTLRLLLIFSTPKKKVHFDYHKLYGQHLELLNSKWRRDESLRIYKSQKMNYLRKLEKHILDVQSFAQNTTAPPSVISNISDLLQRYQNADLVKKDAIPAIIQTTEQLIQELHVLLLEELVPKSER